MRSYSEKGCFYSDRNYRLLEVGPGFPISVFFFKIEIDCFFKLFFFLYD